MKLSTFRHHAFSLVEVTIALAIVALSLVTLLGVMPVGLNTLRSAMDATIQAQITQQMQSKVITTPFANLSTFTTTTYYFDQDGFEQLSTATPSPPNGLTRFQVTFTQQSQAYPGVASGTMDASIVTLLMKIAFYGRGVNAASTTVAIPVSNQSGVNPAGS